MFQVLNDYQIERMLQHRQEEIARETRKRAHLQQLVLDKAAANEQAAAERGFWYKWFGSRRLNTSWK